MRSAHCKASPLCGNDRLSCLGIQEGSGMKPGRFVCPFPFLRSMSLSFLPAIVAAPLFFGGTLAIGQETVLHNFRNNGLGGASPRGGLIADPAGNLYGTTTT